MNSISSTIVIGVTGGVGAGKSTAQKICCNLGFPSTDVDKYVHKILDDSSYVNTAILKRFNSQFNSVPLLKNGSIDRKAIAEKAFYSHNFKLFLENLIHPIVKKFALDWICFQKKKKLSLLLFLCLSYLKAVWIKWLIFLLIFLPLSKTELTGLLKIEDGQMMILAKE